METSHIPIILLTAKNTVEDRIECYNAGDGGYINPYSNNFNGFGQLMMLNLAIGGINGRPVQAKFPLEYCVDYVRVYQK